MSNTTNILLCGVGGQGTVLASKILARCAIARGEQAHTAETIGMAQRGGCVTSHVRIGPLNSPLISKGQADAVIAFEPGEAVRCLPYLKQDGAMIVSSSAVKPITETLSGGNYGADEMLEYLKSLPCRVVFVDGKAIAEACGSAKVLNMALLGAAAASGHAATSPDEIEAIISTLSPRYRDANIKALHMGVELAQ